MEEELRDMKARKDYYNMLYAVADAQQGIPQICPCGSITKELVDEEDTYDYLPGKRYFICKDYEVYAWNLLLSFIFFEINLQFDNGYYVFAE